MVVESVLNELEHLETFPLPQMMMVSTSCNGSEEHCVVPLVYNIYGGEGGGGGFTPYSVY